MLAQNPYQLNSGRGRPISWTSRAVPLLHLVPPHPHVKSKRPLMLESEGRRFPSQHFKSCEFPLCSGSFKFLTSTALQTTSPLNLAFFAPDCFHFSQAGHGLVAAGLWNNLVSPIGHKNHGVDPGLSQSQPLLCPDPSCPLIRTPANSDDCSAYLN